MDPNRKYVFQRCFFNGYVWFLASVCIKKSDLARFTQEVKPSAAGKSRCGRSLSYQAFDSSDEEVWQIGLKPWWSRRHHHHHHVWHAHTHTQSIQHPTSFANLSFAKPFLSKGMAKTSSLPPPAPSLQVDVASELLMGFGVSEPPLVSSELPGCQPWRVQRGGGGSLREINMWKWQGSFKSHGGGGGKWVATWWEACRKKIGHIPQQLREYYLMGTDFHVISVCFWCLYSRNWLTLMTQWLPLLPLRSYQVCQRAWPWNMCLGNPEDVGRDVKAEPQLGSHPLQKTIVFQVVWRKLR